MKRTLEDRYLSGEISFDEYLDLSRDLAAYKSYTAGLLTIEQYLDLLQSEYRF